MLGFNGCEFESQNCRFFLFSRCFFRHSIFPREPIFHKSLQITRSSFGATFFLGVIFSWCVFWKASQVGSWLTNHLHLGPSTTWLFPSRMEVPTAEELWRTKQGGLWRPEHGVVRCQCWCNWKIGELPSWFQDGHGVLFEDICDEWKPFK